MDIDGLPIWSKVGDLDLTAEQLEEMEKAGVCSFPLSPTP